MNGALKISCCIRLATNFRMSPNMLANKCRFSSSWKTPVSKEFSAGMDAAYVENLAQMAHLSLEPDQIPKITHDLRKMVEWFEELQEVDTAHGSVAHNGDLDARDHFRGDLPEDFPDRESLKRQFPEASGPFLAVPRTATSEGE